MFKGLLSLISLFFLAAPAVAQIPASQFAEQSNLNHVWVVIAAALVFFMQVGFLLLEAGSVRSKNSVNVAQKNLIDFILSSIAFGCLGFMLMFGSTQFGMFGWDSSMLFFGLADDWTITFFIFQLMFCGTAATIVSGAVAERMAINGYIICTLMIALLIYPVAGHWAWGGLLNEDNETWLSRIGFLDFAGSTVVHGVGAWVALAAAIIIGPRIGKFEEDGTPITLHGHSPVLATGGAIILWIGWIGFNGGSTLAGDSGFATVIGNTMIAGAGGGLAMMTIGRFSSGYFRPEASINGLLAGLVAITAGPDIMSSQASFFIGVLGGCIAFGATYVLEHILKIDDPLGAIPVHGAAGAFGTLAIAFFAPLDALPAGSRLAQLWVQFQGVGMIFLWAFGVAYVVLTVIDKVLKSVPGGDGHGLRVPEEWEKDGLNVSEHDAPLGTGLVQTAMLNIIKSGAQELERLEMDKGDDAYEIATLYNGVMDLIQAAQEEENVKYKSSRSNRIQLEEEIQDLVEACQAGDFSKRISLDNRDKALVGLCKSLNALCQTSESKMGKIQHCLDAIAEGDLEKRLEGDYVGTLAEIQASMDTSLDYLQSLVDGVSEAVQSATAGDFTRALDQQGKQGFYYRLNSEINALLLISEKGLSDLFDTLHKIGQGDLTSKMPQGYQGRFAEIGEAVESMTKGVSDLVLLTKNNAQNVLGAGGEITRLNGDICAQSEEQARKISQSDALIREVADLATSTASAIARTNEYCRDAANKAEEGRELASETEAQIQRIMSAAQSIAGSVAMIEDIAAQITMLSLNASVEAMRASGGNGQNEGFKVVAQEVRNLATQTADVVAEIRDKSDYVRESVLEGATLVGKTRESLTRISSAMGETAQIVEELDGLGAEQKSRSSQMQANSEQISKSASSNLEIARDSSRLTDELNDVTKQTVKQLEYFRCHAEEQKFAA